MRRLLENAFGIREGEGLRSSLMFGYVFFILASLLVVKPVRNSLFLTYVGAEKLPYAFIFVALTSIAVVSFYSNYERKLRLNVLLRATLSISIVSLLIFRCMFIFHIETIWFVYVFYVWVAIFGVTVTTQFWLLANYVFNAREAKRLFGFIGAGAISGSIFGGYFTDYFASVVGTENLLFFCVGFLSICLVLLELVWRKYAKYNYREKLAQQKRMKRAGFSESSFKLLFKSRYLVYMSSLVGIGVIVANIVDYQFNFIASEAFSDEDELTAFFGFWLSNLSVISLFIQLFITSRVLRALGVGASLFFLPLGILFGSIAILSFPGIISALAVKLSDGSLKHSIYKAGLELLSMPIPARVKNQAKTFIGVFVDNAATGISGLMLIFFGLFFGLPVHYISIVVIVLIALWLILITRVKKEYVNSFRLAIEGRSINLDEHSVNLDDASILNSLLKHLEGDNPRQLLYVLKLLSNVENEQLAQHLKRLIEHPSPEVKVCVLRMAQNQKSIDISAEAERSLMEDDLDVRAEAVSYLAARSGNTIDTLIRYVESEDLEVRTAALLCAAAETAANSEMRKNFDFLVPMKHLFSSVETSDISEENRNRYKTNAAIIIGEVKRQDLYGYLHALLREDSPEVLAAALKSAGMTGAVEFVPSLIPFLNRKNLKMQAREALAELGSDIIPQLLRHLNDEAEDLQIRIKIPRVLALIGTRESSERLIENINRGDARIRYEIIKSLNKLREKSPDITPNTVEVNVLLEDEIRYFSTIVTIRSTEEEIFKAEAADGAPEELERARRLMLGALTEKIDESLEIIFRLLGLVYNPDDLYNAYNGIVSRNRGIRADSVEFLDNILNAKHKELVIPVADAAAAHLEGKATRKVYRPGIHTEADCIATLLSSRDRWLKVCAIYLSGVLGERDKTGAAARYAADPDPLIKETAEFALRQQ